MHHRHQHRVLAIIAGAAIAAVWGPRIGAQAPVKRPVPYSVYDSWRSIRSPQLSRDGQWLAYALTAPGDDGELVVRNLRTGQQLRHPRGTNPAFTPDGRFVVFTIVPPKAEEEAAGGTSQAASAPAARGRGAGRGGAAGGNSRNALGIMALPGGQVTTVEHVASFRLPEESSARVAYRKAPATRSGRGAGGRGGAAAGAARGARPPTAGEPAAAAAETGRGRGSQPPEKRKEPGTDLVVRNLASGDETTIPEVTDYVWNKDGSWLAYAVSSATPANDGAFARRMNDGLVATLHKGRGHYRDLAFDDAGRQLAFLSDEADYDRPVSPYRLYYWKPGDAAAAELVSGTTRGMPAGMVVSEYFAPRFSDDGARLFLGTAPPPPAPPKPGAKAPVKVDIWSYTDKLIQPMQQVRATAERERNYRAVVHLAGRRLVQLATPDLPTVNPGADPTRSIGTSDLPYEQEISWDTSYNDVSLVDLRSGQRRKILEHFHGSASLSPGGGFVLYFDRPSGDWFTYRIRDGARTDLTRNLPVEFYQEDHDTPDLPGAYGSAGWTDGDRSVLLYDRFDIWEIRPDGTGAHMVTGGEGRTSHVVFRYRPLDREARTIPTNKPILLAAADDETRASGFYRVTLGSGGAPEKLLMLDKRVGTPIKAKDADVVVFTEQRFDEFPDLWTSDTDFASPKRVTDANPQQAEFTWGKAEQIHYVNGDGRTLGALLIKPDNFDPSKKYPLMVYIYERLSQGLHTYHAPNVGTSINVTRYVSHGYVVLEPDIVYEVGYPGPSALKCVVPAVNTVVAMGFIDPQRIGIQGHSWGGYEIAYLLTQTNIFAAAEAGAVVADMFSAYGGIRWGSGMVREFQYEKTQSRIGSTPWDSPQEYMENSPLFWVKRVQTPYLTIANDADDAVPWYQGIEFFTALRRLGKQAYMFVFNGERHGLRNRDNQKYWTVHLDEFFDHYLLGKPEPDWMKHGVPYLERGRRDVSPLFEKAVEKPSAGGGAGGGK